MWSVRSSFGRLPTQGQGPGKERQKGSGQSVVEVDEKEPSALAPHEVLGMDFWSGQAVRLKDGDGIISDAAWKEPKSVDRLGALRRVFMQRISSWNLPVRLSAHVATAKREPLLNEREVCVLQQDMAAFLTSEGFPCSGGG